MEFVVEGKKGAGKGILAVRLIKDYLDRGRPVATNMNLFLEGLCPPESRTTVYRLPDKPKLRDFEAIGRVDTKGVEEKNGLIVLDECASWLNTRAYKDVNRAPIFEWFLHSRKLGWDVVYLIQSFDALDKQFRDSFAEYRVSLWRLDRLPIPILGPLSRILLGFNPAMPKVHVAGFFYGQSRIKSYAKWTIGQLYYKAYDTTQVFNEDNEFQGVSSQLSAWHMRGRHQTRWQMYKGVMFGGFFFGCICAFFLTISGGKLMGYKRPDVASTAKVTESLATITGLVKEGPFLHFTTSDGLNYTSNDFALTATGYRARVGSTWYVERTGK